jgi:hypothetical protein
VRFLSLSVLSPLPSLTTRATPACSYLKIGACRHGERCSRKHIKPQYSQTIVILNMYQVSTSLSRGAFSPKADETRQSHPQNPAHVQGSTSNPHLRPKDAPPLDPNPASQLSEAETQEQFDKFCEARLPSLSRPLSPSLAVTDPVPLSLLLRNT